MNSKSQRGTINDVVKEVSDIVSSTDKIFYPK